jgi:membrane-bound lytic murein transglycosylase A
MPLSRRTVSFASLAGWPGAISGPIPHADITAHYRPELVGEGHSGQLTGYYEPELPARLQRGGAFQHPLYAPPPDLPSDRPWLTRRDIELTGVLAGLELAWLDDPLQAFLLQVQGSGRLILPDGQMMRLGYAARNGHPYASLGRWLVAMGHIAEDAVDIPAIRAWAAANPALLQTALWQNPSFVFFKVIEGLDPALGPLGTAQLSLTAGHSIAVDPDIYPMGQLFWLDSPGLSRLVIAQDTGSAIKGPQRADLFCGTGAAAGDMAGQLNQTCRLFALVPLAD